MLDGRALVHQAPLFDCPPFDPFPFQQDALSASEVNVSRGEIVPAFVVALMAVGVVGR